MAEEQDHSLRMQIDADFGMSTTKASDFESSLDRINESIESMSDNLSKIKLNRGELDKGVLDSLNKIYEGIRNGAFIIDGKNVTDVIQKKLADAISSRGILIKDLEEKKEALEVDINENTAKAFRDSLANALGELASTIKITGIPRKKLDIPINDSAIISIQERFNEVMRKTLAEKVNFVTSGNQDIQLLVSDSDYQNIMNKVKENFFNILNNPALVKVDEKKLKPIVVSSEQLEKALENVQKAIGNIDAKFEGNMTQRLRDLPDVKTKIRQFQEHTGALFTELEQTIEAIDMLNPSTKNYDRLKSEAANMRNMIIAAGTDVVKETLAVFEKTVNIDGNADDKFVKGLLTDLGAVRNQINNYLKDMTDQSTLALLKELQVARTTVNGQEVFVPSVQKLQESIALAAKESLKGLSGANLKIDTTAVNQIFEGWATSTSQHLMANSVTTLTDLQKSLLSSNEKVMKSFVKSLEKIAKIDYTPIEDASKEPIKIQIDTPNVRKQVQTHLRSLVDELTEKVNFTTAADASVKTGITLTKAQTNRIQSSIAELLEGQLRSLSESLNLRMAKDFDANLLEKFDKTVFDEAKNLVGTIVKQANDISRAISDGIGSSSFNALSTAEQKAIEERFRTVGDKLVKDFSSLMDNALGSFVLTSSIAEEVKQNFQRELNKLASQTELSFDDERTPIVLHGLVADIQRNLQNTVKMNVEAWQPDLLNFDPDINFKSMFDNINKAINSHLDRVGDELLKAVEQQTKPVDKRTEEQFVKTQNTKEGVKSVLTPKRIMGEELKRLKAQGFAFNNKSDNGYEYTLKDSSKFSEGELVKLVAELNTKFNEIADKKAAQVREVNVEVSKQKIVSALAPIRGSVLTYLGSYAKAIANAVNEINPSVDSDKVNADLSKKISETINKVCTGTERAIERKIDNLNKAMANVLSNIQSDVGKSDDLNIKQQIKTKDLHAEVKKLFAKQYDVLVKDFEKANPTFEGTDGINSVLEKNVQAIMNKFHDTVTGQAKESIGLYLQELNKIKSTPRTDSVNHVALALDKIQKAFEEKIRDMVGVQAEQLASYIRGYGGNRPSIGANVSALVTEAIKGQPSTSRQPVNYGAGLPFPDFDDDDIPKAQPRSVGFQQMPGESEWLSNIQDKVDQDWSAINSWVNSRILDGVNAKSAVKGKIPNDLEEHLFDYIDNHFIPSVKGVATMPYDSADADASARVREEMTRIIQDFKLATSWVKNLMADNRVADKEESFELQRNDLAQLIENLKTFKGISDNDYSHLTDLLKAAVSTNDLKTVRQEAGGYRDLYRAMDKEDSHGLQQDGLRQIVSNLRNNPNFPQFALDDIDEKINVAETANDLKRVRLELTSIRDLYSSIQKNDAFDVKVEKLRSQIDALRNLNVGDNDILGLDDMLNRAKSTNALERVRMQIMSIREQLRNSTSAESFDIQRGNLRNQVNNLANLGNVPSADLAPITLKIDTAQTENDLKRVRLELQEIRDLHRIIASEESFQFKQEGLRQQLAPMYNNATIPDNAIDPIGQLINTAQTENDLKNIRLEIARIKEEYRNITADESFNIQQDGLRQQVDNIRNGKLVPENELNSVDQLIDAAKTANDLKRVRLELNRIRTLQRAMIRDDREREKEEEDERKRGTMLGQNDALKTNNVLQAELLQHVLRQISAFQNYNVEQLRINNATNTWSARLKDVEGNVRSVQGTVDRATGSLYQHSEALSSVASQSAKLASMTGPKYGGGASQAQNTYYGSNVQPQGNAYNPNGDFSSSVYNTMRYMTAGAIMGYPSMMLWQAWESNKEFEYQMERARQNFVIKGDLDQDKLMEEVAVQRVIAQNPNVTMYNDKGEYTDEGQALYKAEQEKLLGLAGNTGDVAATKIQNMAMKYRIDTEKAAQAFHISSRLLDDPNDAYAMTEAVVKANSIEEMDIETGTKGMEAVASQWGVKGQDFEEIIDMMITAANLSPATVEDLLATQQRSGSIFKDALPGMTKRDAISTSVALSAMFNQSTARSGTEGGTFFKTILQSPFTKKGAKTLQELSTQEGFEELNPYNDDGSQKDFVSLFSTIMEKSLTLPDQQKKELWANIFPQWHQGSASAIESFMNDSTQDLQKILEDIKGSKAEEADEDKDGEISFKEAFQYYIDRVANPDDDIITEMLRGNAQTWKQQLQLLGTTWQAATSGVFDDLKDEFGMLAHYMTVYMRYVRDNSEMVASAISMASKLAVGYGVSYGTKKVIEKVKDSNTKGKTKQFENVGNYVFEERRAHNLKKIAIQDQLKGNAVKGHEIEGRRRKVTEDLSNLRPTLEAKKAERNAKQQHISNLITRQNNGEDVSVDLGRARAEFANTEQEINRLRVQLNLLESEFNSIEQEEKELAKSTQKLNDEFNEQVTKINSANNRLNALADAMDDVGLNSKNIRSQVEKLNNEFKSGTTTTQQYEQQLSDIARESGLSEANLQRLREEVERLNKDFADGALSADKYAAKMKELETGYKLGDTGIQGGGVSGAGTQGQSGIGLLDMVVAGSLLAGGVGMKRGIFDRAKDAIKTKSIKNAFGRGEKMKDANGNVLYEQNADGTTSNRPIYTGDVLTENRRRTTQTVKDDEKWYKKGIFGKVGSVTEKIGNSKAGGLLKIGKSLSLAGLASTVGLGAIDLVSSVGMEDFEKSEAKAKKLEALARDAESFQKGGAVEKVVSGFNLLSDITMGGLNSWLGGNEASWGDSWKAVKGAFGGKDNLQNELLKDYDVKGLREQSQKQEEEYLERTDPDYEPLDSSLDDLTDAVTEEEQALIDLNEAVSELNTTMNRQLSMLDADKTIEETKLLLSGSAEDSQEMRDLRNKYLNESNAVLQETLSELESKMSSVSDKDSDVYKDMELQKKQLEAQIATNNYEKHTTDMSEYDEIMGRLSDELASTEDEYGIEEAQAKLGGASDDSPIIKKLEAAKVSDSNASIEQAQTDLQGLVSKLNLREGSADYMKIQNTIKDLEQQQLDNLVAIKSNLDKSQGTFNLPSGVKVTDYMSHMMAGNSHTNVTSRSGDTVVNVTISNLTGSTSDVKTVTDSIASAVKQANQQTASNFNKQVWSGMGSGYTSPY